MTPCAPRARQTPTGGRRERSSQPGRTRSIWTASTRPWWSRIKQLPASKLKQRLAHATVVGIQPEQCQGTTGLGFGAHAEDERRADKVLDRLPLADQCVGDELRADDRNGQLRTSHALERAEQRATDGVAEQTPALVEGEHLQRSRSALMRCIAKVAMSRTICWPTRSDCEYSAALTPGSGAGGRGSAGR